MTSRAASGAVSGPSKRTTAADPAVESGCDPSPGGVGPSGSVVKAPSACRARTTTCSPSVGVQPVEGADEPRRRDAELGVGRDGQRRQRQQRGAAGRDGGLEQRGRAEASAVLGGAVAGAAEGKQRQQRREC
jgi:hypothetical protein